MEIRFINTNLNDYLGLFTTGPPVKAAIKRELIEQTIDTDDLKESIIHVIMKRPIMDAREQVLKRTIKKMPDGKTLHCF